MLEADVSNQCVQPCMRVVRQISNIMPRVDLDSDLREWSQNHRVVGVTGCPKLVGPRQIACNASAPGETGEAVCSP